MNEIKTVLEHAEQHCKASGTRLTPKRKGILKELYDPLWISGIISTSRIENDVALAAYKMEMEFSEIYEEEG